MSGQGLARLPLICDTARFGIGAIESSGSIFGTDMDPRTFSLRVISHQITECELIFMAFLPLRSNSS